MPPAPCRLGGAPTGRKPPALDKQDGSSSSNSWPYRALGFLAGTNPKMLLPVLPSPLELAGLRYPISLPSFWLPFNKRESSRNKREPLPRCPPSHRPPAQSPITPSRARVMGSGRGTGSSPRWRIPQISSLENRKSVSSAERLHRLPRAARAAGTVGALRAAGAAGAAGQGWMPRGGRSPLSPGSLVAKAGDEAVSLPPWAEQRCRSPRGDALPQPSLHPPWLHPPGTYGR